MSRLYLAGPYRAIHPYLVEENVAKHRKAAALLTMMGFSVFSPILNSHPIAGCVPEERFLECDLEWLRVSQLLVLLPSWEQSEGSRVEKREAELCGIRVYVWPNDREVLEREAKASE